MDIFELFKISTICIGQKETGEMKRKRMISIICKELDITPEQMFTWGRKREWVLARYIFMYLLCAMKIGTLYIIGEYAKCEGRKAFDHSTVLHAVKTINDRRDTDKVFRAVLEKIEMQIK